MICIHGDDGITRQRCLHLSLERKWVTSILRTSDICTLNAAETFFR